MAAPTMKHAEPHAPQHFANALPLTHADRRRLQALTNKRYLGRLTADETLERAALRFRLIGTEVA